MQLRTYSIALGGSAAPLQLIVGVALTTIIVEHADTGRANEILYYQLW